MTLVGLDWIVARCFGKPLSRNNNITEIAARYGLNPDILTAIARDLASARAPLALPGWDIDSARAAALVNEKTGSRLVLP